MLNCPASVQSGTGMKELTILKPVRYQTEPTQYGIFLVCYQQLKRNTPNPHHWNGNRTEQHSQYSGWSECDYTDSDWSEREDKLERGRRKFEGG
jgi:hypothetical protein